MNRTLHYIFCSFAVALFFTSCYCACCNEDCGPEIYYEISILSSSDSTDLIADGTYDPATMKLERSEGGILEDVPTILVMSTVDSIPDRMVIYSFAEPARYLITLSSTDIDTVDFKTTFFDGDCCDVYRIDSVSVNNSSFVSIVNDQVVLLK